MTPPDRTLILMRHAEAADFAPGRHDHDRPLTDRGHDQARAAAVALAPFGIDHALVSSARRTRETAADLRLPCRIDHVDDLYNADPDTIRRLVSEAPGEARTLLVVAHNPGIHAAALELGDAAGHPEGARLAYSFPTATAVALVGPGDGWNLTPGVPITFVHFAH